MEENSIRYVVEQRCKAHRHHEVKLGAISTYSKHPARDVQLLIRDVFKCPDCTFHCKFHVEDLDTLIKPETDKFDKKLPLYGRLVSIIVLFILGVTSATISILHGITHPLTVLSISVFLCILFSSLDAFTSEKISTLQWYAFFVNVMMLIYSFLLLPTLEALDVLNRSGVKQNLLQLFLSVM